MVYSRGRIEYGSGENEKSKECGGAEGSGEEADAGHCRISGEGGDD
jgi:hypothetical protein